MLWWLLSGHFWHIGDQFSRVCHVFLCFSWEVISIAVFGPHRVDASIHGEFSLQPQAGGGRTEQPSPSAPPSRRGNIISQNLFKFENRCEMMPRSQYHDNRGAFWRLGDSAWGQDETKVLVTNEAMFAERSFNPGT